MLIRWLVLTVAVWVATVIIPGIQADTWQSLVVAALVLGILNAFVRPILLLVSLPLLLLTLGLFLLVINALLLKLTDALVPGFHVNGFWPAVGGSLIISIVGLFLGGIGARAARRRTRVVVEERPPPQKGPPPGKGPIIDV